MTLERLDLLPRWSVGAREDFILLKIELLGFHQYQALPFL